MSNEEQICIHLLPQLRFTQTLVTGLERLTKEDNTILKYRWAEQRNKAASEMNGVLNAYGFRGISTHWPYKAPTTLEELVPL